MEDKSLVDFINIMYKKPFNVDKLIDSYINIKDEEERKTGISLLADFWENSRHNLIYKNNEERLITLHILSTLATLFCNNEKSVKQYQEICSLIHNVINDNSTTYNYN